MATYSADWIQLARETSEPYIPIALSAVRLDSRPPVGLYMRQSPSSPEVLYAAANTPFTVAQLQRLKDSGVRELLIQREDQAAFRRYLEWHISDLLADDAIVPRDKAQIVHFTSRGLVQDLIQDPSVDEGFRRSGVMVENTVEYLFRDPAASRHLITTASFDYTAYSHAVNSAVYALTFVQYLGLRKPETLSEFGLAVLLRDVGLSRIDEKNWDGERAMSLQQFELYKQHPVAGEQILRENGLITSESLRIVRHHHEKLSGRGFPDGLGGGEIGNYVRIVNIADMFDTLTTNREYRPGHTSYQALHIMSTELEKDYDQELLRAFVAMMGNPG